MTVEKLAEKTAPDASLEASGLPTSSNLAAVLKAGLVRVTAENY